MPSFARLLLAAVSKKGGPVGIFPYVHRVSWYLGMDSIIYFSDFEHYAINRWANRSRLFGLAPVLDFSQIWASSTRFAGSVVFL